MTRVVLVGGGYVTLHACAELVRRLGSRVRRGDVEVVVISADDCHSFHGLTGEVVAGILPFERTRTPLAEACPLATVVHGTVTRVDPLARTVTVRRVGSERAEELTYDELVVGTGGREPVGTVPGLAEHGLTLRGPGEIEALLGHLDQLLRQGERVRYDVGDAGADVTRDRHRVVVAGGGVAGAELAAAVADRGRGRLEVLLVHSGDQLLPELRQRHPRLAERSEHELERLGVRVLLSTRLWEVTEDGAVLRMGSGAQAGQLVTVPGTVLATIGQAPVRLPGLEALARDGRGRLVTRSDLSVGDGLWSAGDAARVLHPRTGDPVPANALWAIKGGAHLGRNLARALQGRPTRPFGYQGLGQAASFGLGRSVGDLYGVELTGQLAWTMRMAFFLRFMPSRRRAAAVVADLAALTVGGRPKAAAGMLR
ncbi:NAD(P)/FAD-dependent oxidoreductase [Ornithinimicrobium cerasi]|uniref:NADH dehydrogenase n=1 Tax=Ornithinimicrobium cerasi TaxID=2248773 RepID=A0A285VRH2_9MICO|nr:FAD-dependent oxidoreductase [Ornithinimicrobium cerasi]SOC56649.1 NADH dehydrogenase [Ornithinimicrobium cerasi]